METNDSVLPMEFPKQINLPHKLAIFLKFSQVHPWGGTPKISNYTLLDSQTSYLSHFLILSYLSHFLSHSPYPKKKETE